MNLVFIYLGEECLVITYSASELVLWTPDVILFTEMRKVYNESNPENLLEVDYIVFLGTNSNMSLTSSAVEELDMPRITYRRTSP